MMHNCWQGDGTALLFLPKIVIAGDQIWAQLMMLEIFICEDTFRWLFTSFLLFEPQISCLSMERAAWAHLWDLFYGLTKTHAPVSAPVGSNSLQKTYTQLLGKWKRHQLLHPVTNVPPWLPLWEWLKSTLFPEHSRNLYLSSLGWIIESSHWISSKPQTNPSHSLSLNSRFPSPSP